MGARIVARGLSNERLGVRAPGLSQRVLCVAQFLLCFHESGERDSRRLLFDGHGSNPAIE